MGYNKRGYDQVKLRKKGKRRCSRCKKIQSVDNFYRCKSKRQGLSYRCKPCANADTKESRDKQTPLGRWAHRIAAKKQSLQRTTGVPCDIDADYIMSIYPKDDKCPVLGITLEFSIGRTGPAECSPTLDRIDPLGGYIKSNVCVILQRANRLKNDATLDEVKKIFDWYTNQYAIAT